MTVRSRSPSWPTTIASCRRVSWACTVAIGSTAPPRPLPGGPRGLPGPPGAAGVGTGKPPPAPAGGLVQRLHADHLDLSGEPAQLVHRQAELAGELPVGRRPQQPGFEPFLHP